MLPGTSGAVALVVPIAHVACRPDSVCPILFRCHEKVLRSLKLEEEERFWIDVELINLSLEAVSCTPSPRSCAKFVTRRDV